MNKWIYVLLGILFTIIVGLNVYLWINLKSQKEIYNIVQQSQCEKIDSLNNLNIQYSEIIDSLSNKIYQQDSLILNINEEKKQLLLKLDGFKLQNDLDSSVIILRQNIWNELH